MTAINLELDKLSESTLDYLIKRFLKDEQNPYIVKYEGYDAKLIFILLGYCFGNLKVYIEKHPDIYQDAQEHARLMSYIW